MGHEDTHTIPDVAISGRLAVELLEILEWAVYHAEGESAARAQIVIAHTYLTEEATASWRITP